MAEHNPSVAPPVTPSNQQTFDLVSINNTPLTYKSNSQVDGQGEGAPPKPDLKTTRLTKFLKEEMLQSTPKNTSGLLEVAFPDSDLPISVDDAVKLLLEHGKLTETGEKLDWTDDISALATYNRPDGTHPEDRLKDFLNDLGTVLLGSRSGHESRRWSTVARAAALPGGPAERKPDLVLTSELEEKGITWRNIHSTLQLKYKDNSAARTGNANHLSSDAFMTLSSQDTRRFFLGTSICGYMVRIYAFNRAGRVSSTPFDIRKDPHSLIRLLIGLTMCPTNMLGLDASYIWNSAGNYFVITIDGVAYRLLDCVFRSKCIRGRGTTCWRAVRDDDPDGLEYAIKDTWTDTSRTPEADLMKHLAGVEGIPTLVAAEKLAHADGRDVTSYFFQGVVNKETKGKGKEKKREVEAREHWIIVSTPFAKPLPSFSSKKELLSALVDAIRAHQGMLAKEVLHRDISVDNIMLYTPVKAKTPEDAEAPEGGNEAASSPAPLKRGLLIDVDYGIKINQGPEDRKTAIGHRTGTLPFMSIEILEGESSIHGAHHDLESMFYVLVWICIFYRGPNNSPRFRALDVKTANWTGIKDIEVETVALAKTAIFKITDDFDRYIKANIATYFTNLIPSLQELRTIFFNNAVPATHEKMIGILERHGNQLPDIDDWVDDEKPIPTKKRGRNASPERPPTKRMRTNESPPQTRSLPRRMTNLRMTESTSQGQIEEGSDENNDDEEVEGHSSGEYDDEVNDPTFSSG